jgi:isochorismate hydrolase
MAGLPTIAPYVLPTPDTLPENLAQWELRPERAALLVHDMQRFFLRALPEPVRSDLVHNATLVRKRCAALGVPVAYTAQPGRMTPEERGLLHDFWGPGMRTEPADREVTPELAPGREDLVLTKWRYSAFHHSPLLEELQAAGRNQLVLCGVYAHIGVLATALEAFANDIQVFFVADATADFSEADHRLALDYVARRCGMVLPSSEVLG